MSVPMPASAFDPKIREAVGKMLAIAREYDLAAYLVLGGREHTETRLRFPSWSVAQMEEKGGVQQIRFRSTDREDQDIADTISTLQIMGEEAGHICLSLGQLIDKLKEGGWDIETETREGPPAPPWDYR